METDIFRTSLPPLENTEHVLPLHAIPTGAFGETIFPTFRRLFTMERAFPILLKDKTYGGALHAYGTLSLGHSRTN